MPYERTYLILPELDDLRRRMGWTKNRLAAKAHLGTDTITRLYRRGYTSPDTYEALRVALGLEPGALIDFEAQEVAAAS